MRPKNLGPKILGMAAGLSGAILVGISVLAIPTPVSANHIPTVIPSQGAPALDTPFKTIPRPIIGALRKPFRELPQIENFELVGHNRITNPNDSRARGRNGGVAIQANCAYVASRLTRRSGTGAHFGTPELPPEVAIVNIANPANPRVFGHFATHLGSNNREIRTIQDKNTLIILNDGTIDNLDIYDTSNCRNPVKTQTVDFTGTAGHEFYVWRDPMNSNRFLIYVSFSGNEPSLRVFELMNPPRGTFNPVPVATFTLNPAVPTTEPVDPARYRNDHFMFTSKPTNQGNGLHSMAVSDDGKRVYMANSQAGYYILDSTLLAQRAACNPNTVTVDETTNTDPNLCLRKINPDPKGGNIDTTPPYSGIHHSFYPIPNRHYAIGSGERNGVNTCPWTGGQIIDTYDEQNPQIYAHFMVPENLPENCFAGGPGDPNLMREFSTHQPLLFENLYFLSWYSAGLRVWDTSNARLPMEVGVFVPRPERNIIEFFRDSRDVWMWSFPLLHNGLIYVSDDNNGLYILRYTGPRADELPQQGTFGSNDNFGHDAL